MAEKNRKNESYSDYLARHPKVGGKMGSDRNDVMASRKKAGRKGKKRPSGR